MHDIPAVGHIFKSCLLTLKPPETTEDILEGLSYFAGADLNHSPL